MDELSEEEICYAIEESRYDDEVVKEIAQKEVTNFQWSFVVSNGVEDED